MKIASFSAMIRSCFSGKTEDHLLTKSPVNNSYSGAMVSEGAIAIRLKNCL